MLWTEVRAPLASVRTSRDAAWPAAAACLAAPRCGWVPEGAAP